jgi:uncharacterized protein
MSYPPGVQVNVSQTPLAPSVTQSGEGTAAFCLPYNIGPTLPVLVSNFNQFTNLFGTFAQSNGSMLHHSVYQYFANGGRGCYVCRVPDTDAASASLALADLGLTPPAAPTLAQVNNAGTVLAGTYKVEITYTNASGESLPSTFTSITTTGTTSTVTIDSPANLGDATHWYAYMTQLGGSTYTRQQSPGSPTVLGTNLVVSAPPTSGGAAPPGTDTATDNVLTVTATSPGAWGNSVYVAITSANSNSGAGPRFNVLVYNGGNAAANLVETFPSVSVNPNDPRSVASVVNSQIAGSKYITVTVALPTGGYLQGITDPAFVSATALSGGSDGSTVPSSSSSPTLAASVEAAFNTLQDQILQVNLPGLTVAGEPQTVDTTTLNALLTWADGRGDVMLIIDGPVPDPPESSATVASNYTSLVTGGSPLTADPNAVVYGPWLWVLDPSSSVQGAMRYVPPGGAVLAIWDRAVTNYNVAQAPAGTWATIVTQSLEALFTPTDLANMNTSQVNPIKMVPNVGFCVFGARTLDVGLPSRYVNIQRTLQQITHDLENVLTAYTFQPNSAILWENITNAITTYLTQQMQSGVLAGNTPQTAFAVLCDDTINTPTSAQSGYVYAIVGVALASPAEFIVINLQLLSGSSTVVSS